MGMSLDLELKARFVAVLHKRALSCELLHATMGSGP